MPEFDGEDGGQKQWAASTKDKKPSKIWKKRSLVWKSFPFYPNLASRWQAWLHGVHKHTGRTSKTTNRLMIIKEKCIRPTEWKVACISEHNRSDRDYSSSYCVSAVLLCRVVFVGLSVSRLLCSFSCTVSSLSVGGVVSCSTSLSSFSLSLPHELDVSSSELE